MVLGLEQEIEEGVGVGVGDRQEKGNFMYVQYNLAPIASRYHKEGLPDIDNRS